MTDFLIPWNSEHEGYARDESRRLGTATAIAFPQNITDVISVIREAHARDLSITTQGARTGIVAGAVPQGGVVLNLSQMAQIGALRPEIATNTGYLTVQPGALLTDIRLALTSSGFFFPPDPTETSASIGGMVACNASGALTFHYGPTRRWVEALTVVLCDGDVLRLRRGQVRAAGRQFTLTTESGRTITGMLPSYDAPGVKNAAGYYIAQDMDLIDLFIGSEGTLGVITEIEIRLLPRPEGIVGLTAFLPTEEAALKFVRALRGEQLDGVPSPQQCPVALEFFNSDALTLMRAMKEEYSAFAHIPTLKPYYHTAVYAEFHGADGDEVESAAMQALETLIVLGGNDEDTWYATTAREMEGLKAFRHAFPEAANLLIDARRRTCPALTKLGTDMSVPDTALTTVMTMYHDELQASGLESIIFGHIGNNHVHVNILPRDMAEYERGKALYLSWAARIVALGGSVSAEHGIGKIKTAFLALMYGDVVIDEMRALRVLFDPTGLMNPGNLF